MARGAIVVRIQKDGTKRYATVIRIDGRQKWKTFAKKKEAEAYLDRNSSDVRENTYRELIPASFKQYAERWRTKYLIPEDLKPSTLNGYRSTLAKHLIPRFASRPMAAVTTADITDFRADLLKGGLSPKFVKNILNLLNRFFADAQEDGYVKVSPIPTRRRKKDSGSNGKAGKKGRARFAPRRRSSCSSSATTMRS
jgi:hypothetical protein